VRYRQLRSVLYRFEPIGGNVADAEDLIHEDPSHRPLKEGQNTRRLIAGFMGREEVAGAHLFAEIYDRGHAITRVALSILEASADAFLEPRGRPARPLE